jgi:hypothetical protein
MFVNFRSTSVHPIPLIRFHPFGSARSAPSIHQRPFVVVHPRQCAVFFKSYVLHTYVSNTIFFKPYVHILQNRI